MDVATATLVERLTTVLKRQSMMHSSSMLQIAFCAATSLSPPALVNLIKCRMSGRGGGGRGRGWYYKQKYGGGGANRNRQFDGEITATDGGNGAAWGGGYNNAGDGAGQAAPAAAAGGGGDYDEEEEHVNRQPANMGRVRGNMQQLSQELHRLEGKGYKAYRDIEGAWQADGFTLLVDHVQGDPYASPSRFRVQVPSSSAQLPPELYSSKLRRVALADWLARKLSAKANRASATAAGQASGWHGAKGGDVHVDMPGQHVLERTAVLVSGSGAVEGRFTVGLPAQGRSIMGRWAAQIITQHIARAVHAALFYPSLDGGSIWSHIQTVEDTEALRQALPGLGLVGFVGNGAILPRKSGASDLPMSPHPGLVAFASPASLAVEVTLPHRGVVRGMGIRRGITLIAGGGFHGKSTLLQALEAGVYNKVPGDGRELVVMLSDAVKVAAEDGRRVEGVDISPFINNLPGGTPTHTFRSDDASGSTSQAANIQEALELGASALLMDEDTCATNFMMRDARMAALVAADREPITPFSTRIAMLRAAGVSTVLVMGGSGDYFADADTVIVMDNYTPSDQTAAAHSIAAQHAATLAAAGVPQPPQAPAGAAGVWVTPRVPLRVYSGCEDNRGVKTHVRGLHHIQYGNQDVQLSAAEQLVDRSQTRAVADAMKWLQARLKQQHPQQQQGGKTLRQWLEDLEAAFDQQGLDVLAPHLLLGNLARPRRFEMAAAINRIRTLQVSSTQQQPLAS